MIHLTSLGIVHTIISIFAVIAALIALFREGVIAPRTSLGSWYIGLTIASCLTSFGIMKTGHFSVAHAVSVLVLVIIVVALLARRLFGKSGERAEIICMTLTLYFSFIPAVTETLTRVPVSQPIAENQDAPILKTIYLALTVIFAIGIFLQLRKQRQHKQLAA
ncbi:MAG: hypothetical protein JST68_05545 [Bacteroidetes bacterium]|nr:hypothetical protein [Bacteroidota bacterium]